MAQQQCLSEESLKHQNVLITDHREQDDVFKPGHHLWAQPAPQAEELRQGVQRPELGQSRGEHSRHRRAAEDDRQLPNPLPGQCSELLSHSSSLILCNKSHVHSCTDLKLARLSRQISPSRKDRRINNNREKRRLEKDDRWLLCVGGNIVLVSWYEHHELLTQILEAALSKIKAESSCMKSSVSCQKKSRFCTD